MRKYTRRSRSRSGLTLIEVMLVLVILTILAAAVVMNFDRIFATGLERTAKIEISGLENAVQSYQFDVRQYPPNLEALLEPPADLSNPKRWKGPYVQEQGALVDPWDQPYQFQYPGRQHPDRFDIWSVGPDKQDGTEDDVGNWES